MERLSADARDRRIAPMNGAGYNEKRFSVEGKRRLPTIEVIGRLQVSEVRWPTGNVSRVFQSYRNM